MRNRLYIALASALVMLFACQKEQDFKHTDINKISVVTKDSSFTLTQFDTLRIVTEIRQTKPGATLNYKWTVYPRTYLAGKAVELSTEKDLKTVVNLSPGTYYVQLDVTDGSTGVVSQIQYGLTVNGAFYEGWIVANNKDGNARLSFIRADDTLMLNAIGTANKKDYPGRVLGVGAGLARDISLIYFFTDQGAYRFTANDMFENGTTTSMFPKGKSFNSKVGYGLTKLLADQYIVDSDGLYAGFGPLFYAMDVTSPYSPRLSGDYTLFPYPISSAYYTTYFYDNKYKRFMQIAYLERELLVAGTATGATFDMSNTGKTMIAADLGPFNSSSAEFYLVMTDGVNRFLYSLAAGVPAMNQQIGSSPDIAAATAFATSSMLKHMYYAAANKIYLYDMLANSSRLIYTLPAGYEVKDLEMLRSSSKRLVVGTNNGAAGEVYYFDLDNTGNFVNNTYVKKFTGFGEIVQLVYRTK
ncbi:PKD-like family lipoprotein [Chitinophaga sedimenti]|uniref:PKD-like family lipoprotein n=1 Tax=Chitinophaga sedimenti TaxID=2033606 RepID=UPI00200306AD|nr:PKD-like family lipoprotein [Chitinophaga sedimenti]MCK7555620.1 PKD-like family lipoprotein [Chitinophaga sedimenti]